MADDTGNGALLAVLETADPSRLALAKSVLDDAGIDYLVQGDGALSLFPLGAYGRGPFRHGLAATIRVHAERAAEARALLETVIVQTDEPADEPADEPDERKADEREPDELALLEAMIGSTDEPADDGG